MTEEKRARDFAAALAAESGRNYQRDVASFDALSPAEATAEARRIIRGLAYSAYQYPYGTKEMPARFDHLWEIAFPKSTSNGTATKRKGGKK